MANPNTQNSPRIRRSEQYIQNASFDEEFQVLALENLEFDGTALQRQQSGNQAVRTATSGSVTYVGFAPIGTATSSGSWQVIKIDTSSGTAVTWADGNANFDNVWDNYASLTYS